MASYFEALPNLKLYPYTTAPSFGCRRWAQKRPSGRGTEGPHLSTHGGEGETCAWTWFPPRGFWERGERRVHAGDGATEALEMLSRSARIGLAFVPSPLGWWQQ